jgi:hypothetical protein
MNRFLIGALMIGVAACEDSTGPNLRGRLLAPASLALEWSADGTEIYYYAAGYSAEIPVYIPDQMLAVNPITRATRVVVDSCALSLGGLARPSALPPRATIAGLAYINRCGVGGQLTLRLVSGSSDSALASTDAWFTSCPNRDCLIYPNPLSSTGDDSVAVIDLPLGVRRAFATGLYRPSMTAAVSPDGDALLLERSGPTDRFAILSLVDGGMEVLPDSILPFPSSGGTPLGWNDDGLWFLAEPRITLVVYDPASGGIQRFSTGETTIGTRVLSSGSVTTTTTAVWMQNCSSIDNPTGDCAQATYGLWLWNPLLALDRLLEFFYTTPAYDFPRPFHAATSPDGQQLAYVLGNELRLLELP